MIVNIDEQEIIKQLNIDHMRQNIRIQIESHLTELINNQIQKAIEEKVQSVLKTMDFTKRIEDLLLATIQRSAKIVFYPEGDCELIH